MGEMVLYCKEDTLSRPPRFSYARALHHVTLRCNNREFLFTDPSFQLFHEILQEGRAKFGLSLYNYCLMTNHVHLLFEVSHEDTLSKAMHWIGNTFSRRFNKDTGRGGHLWEGRFRSAIVEHASYLFRCMAYIDLNPVRARMVSAPANYSWSGHRALKEEDRRELDFHRLYIQLGDDAATRYARYMELLSEEAARPAVSLARAHFVGTQRFVGRMIRRFGLEIGRTAERKELECGLVCVGPKVGGQPPRNAD